MGREGSTAKLAFRHDHLAAVCRQHADSSLVQCREADLRNASREESHPGAALAVRRKSLPKPRKKEFFLDRRHQPFAVGHPEEAKQAEIARESLQARLLIKTGRARQGGDSLGIRKKMTVDEAARDARRKRPAIILFDLRPGSFHELAVLHARRTCRLTSAAIEALV